MSTASTGGGKNYKLIGDEIWKKADKLNGELFALTYGCFVAQVMRDYEDTVLANEQLDKLGYQLGIRLIEELVAKAGLGRCPDFRETADIVRMAIRIFLNVTAGIRMEGENEFFVTLPVEDGLGTEWCELPEQIKKDGLRYANAMVGVIRGALEMVQVQVECSIAADPLVEGATGTEIRVKFIKFLDEELPPADE